MKQHPLRARLTGLAILALAATAAGCAQYGGLEDIIPGARTSVVTGEVRSVDTRSGRLHLYDSRGRSETLRFDRSTRAVYGQRSYPVSYLERGDRVRVRVEYDRQGRAWAERVEVRSSARDRYGSRDRDRDRDRYEDRDRERYKDRGRRARTERLDGTVLWVNERASSFALSPRRGRDVVVSVPRELPQGHERRFERLRRGDRVRVEVREAGRDRYVLVRFR